MSLMFFSSNFSIRNFNFSLSLVSMTISSFISQWFWMRNNLFLACFRLVADGISLIFLSISLQISWLMCFIILLTFAINFEEMISHADVGLIYRDAFSPLNRVATVSSLFKCGKEREILALAQLCSIWWHLQLQQRNTCQGSYITC